MDGPNNRTYIAEDKISKLKYLAKEISQGAIKTKEMKISAKLRDRKDSYRRSNIYLTGVLEGEKTKRK